MFSKVRAHFSNTLKILPLRKGSAVGLNRTLSVSVLAIAAVATEFLESKTADLLFSVPRFACESRTAATAKPSGSCEIRRRGLNAGQAVRIGIELSRSGATTHGQRQGRGEDGFA